MRKRPPWMTGNDETILELMHEKDVILKPKGVKKNLKKEGIDISQRTVYRSLNRLAKHGMINEDPDDDAWYEVSEYGVAFLTEDTDLDQIRERLDID